MRAPRHGSRDRWLPNLGRSGLLYGVLLGAGIAPAFGVSLGILADNGTDRVNVFHADTHQLAMQFAALPGDAVGDCVLTSDERTGFTTNSSGQIAFLELGGLDEPGAEGQVGRLSAPLDISNLGVDMALSPDESFLVLAGGGALQQPLSVIHVRSRTEVVGRGPFVDHTSVEFCDDATLLITTNNGIRYGGTPDDALYTARVDADGGVRLLGERLAPGAQPNNSACAPGSRAGVLLDRQGGVTSFTLPGLHPAGYASTRDDTAVSAAFSADGTRLYVRTSRTVEAFDFDPANGAMRADWMRAVPYSSTYYGMEQIATHPDGDRLYVDGGDVLLIMSSGDGATLGILEAGDATGVCFANAGPAARPTATAGDPEIPSAPP